MCVDLHTRHEIALLTQERKTSCEDMIMINQVEQAAIITFRTKEMFTCSCSLRMHQKRKTIETRCEDESGELHVPFCALKLVRLLHAPSLLAYAEQHRWACGGMGAVSSQIKLWVGGPIAIHHAST